MKPHMPAELKLQCLQKLSSSTRGQGLMVPAGLPCSGSLLASPTRPRTRGRALLEAPRSPRPSRRFPCSQAGFESPLRLPTLYP